MLSLHVVTSAVTDRLTGQNKTFYYLLFFPNKLISEENSDSWKKAYLKHHGF